MTFPKISKYARVFFPALLLFSGIGLFLFSLVPAQAQAQRTAYTIELNDDTINPVTAEYIAGSIEKAYQDNAVCMIIKLDTPGGLLNSARLIVKKMLPSPVPVVVYIAPSGSRAGSAGVFITYASHIAAMAPSTNIGAAHPVQLGENSKRARDNEWDELKDLLKQIKDNQTKETITEKKEVKSSDNLP